MGRSLVLNRMCWRGRRCLWRIKCWECQKLRSWRRRSLELPLYYPKWRFWKRRELSRRNL
ncbi:hypothetical protein BC829DRAFT_405322, partial [Chytridium lagenaria]